MLHSTYMFYVIMFLSWTFRQKSAFWIEGFRQEKCLLNQFLQVPSMGY